ncbi:hypothetical protein ACOMHD_14275 [Xanthomonas codiaei]|uniref:hypothetical protein n=1 Tax=Xanthomonas codiaei TaxID=56463 RepID=UPI00142DACB9|nr:hypothetical protein [Xanthomonas codiaei]
MTSIKKPASADAGFLIPGRLVVLRLVADPHRPRTIIRAQGVAVGVIEVGEAQVHAGDANRSFSLAQLFQRQRRRERIAAGSEQSPGGVDGAPSAGRCEVAHADSKHRLPRAWRLRNGSVRFLRTAIHSISSRSTSLRYSAGKA